jgi:DNA-binding Lrp family transcriptional regulator
MNKKERLAHDFIQIPKLVMNLAPADRFVFGVIYFLCGLSQKKCTASNAYIGEIAHVTPETVTNSLNRLEAEGFIKRYFKDNNNRTRDYIICLVRFSKIPPNDGIDTTKRLDEIPSGDGQIYNNKIKNSTIEQATPGSTKEVFNSESYFKDLARYKGSAVGIVGKYVLDRELWKRCSDKAQCDILKGRNIKVANRLAKFEEWKIDKAIEGCKNNYYKGKPMTWTLETVETYLLEKIKN